MNFYLYLTKQSAMENNLSGKVLSIPNVCGIIIDASTLPLPAHSESLQPFVNTNFSSINRKPVYTSPGKVSITERGVDTRAGMKWQQTVRFSFPGTDPLRGERLKQYTEAKFLSIVLSNGLLFFFGRNDFFQNTKPKVSVESNEKSTNVTYTTHSIHPMGFANGDDVFGFPQEFPINFYD